VGGVQLGPLGTAATNRPIVPTPRDYDDGEIGGMMTGRQGKPMNSEETCPSVALFTPSLTCCPDANPVHRGGKLSTNRLSYGTAGIQ
jgi:hypothetical protein